MSTTLSTTSRQLVLTVSGVPMPISPFVTGRTLDQRDRDIGWRRIAFRVVPHEQHSVLLQRGPLRGPGQSGCPLAVRHTLTAAVAAPAPIVERAGDFVSLYLTLSEVTTHVTAVAVENVDRAVPASEHNQFPSKSVDAVRLAVAEGLWSGPGSASRGRIGTGPSRLRSGESLRCSTAASCRCSTTDDGVVAADLPLAGKKHSPRLFHDLMSSP